MPHTQADASASMRSAPERFRHLPDRVALEDIVESVAGEVSFDPAEERNAFIDAAIQAGG